MVLDLEWSILEPSPNGLHSFLYSSEIEFILIKIDYEAEFQRITPTDTETHSPCIKWDKRSEEEQEYILKVDPVQKVMVAGTPKVRFFRCPKQGEKASTSLTSIYLPKNPVRAWEAEDIQDRHWDIWTGEWSYAEQLVEAARRFQAWRAKRTNRLFVYLMVPEGLSEGEWIQILEHGFQFFDDVPWIL